MYENERGKNDWKIETLGEVSDVVFIGSQQSYILSTDGLLTLFDNAFQSTVWRKQLPVNERESYSMRHLGRNLVVHSDERAIMINSAGHIIFE